MEYFYNKRTFMHIYTDESQSRNPRADVLLVRFIISYSFLLLIILALFSLVFNSYIEKTKERYNATQRTSYISRIELFENYFKIMDLSCRQILQDSDFRRIMNNDEINEESKLLGKAVRENIAVNLYADSLLPLKEQFFYLRNSDYILSSTSFVSSEDYYRIIKKYPPTQKENWLNLLTKEENYNQFIPMNDYRASGEKYLYYAKNMQGLTYLDSEVTAVFVLKKDEIAALFGQNMEVPSSFVAIYDPASQKYILQFCDLDINLDLAITKLNFVDDFASLSIDNEKYTITKYKSGLTGYDYYISFPTFNAIQSSGLSIALLAVIMLSFVVLAFALILWVSRKNVQPLLDIDEKLEVSNEENEKLRSIVDKQAPLLNRSYVRQLLLTGVGSEDECRRICTQLNLDFSNVFNAVYFVVYSNAYNDAKDATDVLSDELINYIIEPFEKIFNKEIPYFKTGDHSISILVDFHNIESQKYINLINEAVNDIHTELLNKFDRWLFAGIGQNTNSLMNVWQSYEQAIEATKHTDKDIIFCKYDDVIKDSQYYYYPDSFQNKLFVFVTNGATIQSIDILRQIKRENTIERTLSPVLLGFLLSDIRNTLVRARFLLPPGTSDEEITKIQNKLKEEPTFDSLEEAVILLGKSFAYSTSDVSVIDAIIIYIKSNYTDPLMCLNKISDVFHISEEYFDHLFSDKTGVSFATYLENLRMAKAMELIKDQKVTPGKAYSVVGYTNPSSFRTAFKRVYGINPSEAK